MEQILKIIERKSNFAFGYLIIAVAAVALLAFDWGQTIDAFVEDKRVALFILWVISGTYFFLTSTYYPYKYRKILTLTGGITAEDKKGDTSHYDWLTMVIMFIIIFDQLWMATIGAIISLVLNDLTKTSSLYYTKEIEAAEEIAEQVTE